MNCKEYIKENYEEQYIKERDYIADRLIEAKFDFLFLKKANEMCKNKMVEDLSDEEIGIRFTLRQIYVSLMWQLAIQIKALTDDTGEDVLDLEEFKNNVVRLYVRDEKVDEVQSSLRQLGWKVNRALLERKIKSVSDYRNKIVGHNFLNMPELTFSLADIEYIIENASELLQYLYFGESTLVERQKDLETEKIEFIENFLNRLLMK